MATVRLNLKRPTATTSAIECIIQDGRDYRIRLATGISVKVKHWSKKGHVLSADTKSVSKNVFLKEFTGNAFSIYLKAKSNGILPDREFFKQAMEVKPIVRTVFWEVWDEYLKSKAGVFKKHSFIKFESLKNHLEKFEEEKGKLVLDTITTELMEDLQNFLYNKLNTQSTEKYIGIFKMFLNWSVKRKFTTNTDFKNFIAMKQPESLKVIMTDEDIKKIKEKDLKEKNYLKNVRSLFLLACDTGLRYSDFSRIGKQHLKSEDGGYFLEIRQTKTDDYVTIPLTPTALTTVQELIEGKLHSITNQKMNEYVKTLCEESEINEPFEVNTYKGRVKTTTVIEKHKLVTTHTGRRTFATNLLQKGIPAEVVMKFTGHKDYRSFSKYVNIPRKSQMQIVRQALEGITDKKMSITNEE